MGSIKPPQPKPPRGLSKSAQELFNDVHKRWGLYAHEEALLVEACQIKSAIDELQAIVEQEGRIIENRQGNTIVHPAQTECRQLQIVFTRIIATLGLTDDGRRANRNKNSARGLYSIHGGRAV